MVAEPTLDPIITREEEQDESDEGEESDIYELEGDEEGDAYTSDEDDDEGEDDDEVVEGRPDNMTALLLGKQNGTTEDGKEEDEEDEEYREGKKGTAPETPIDPSSAVAGLKRGVDELAEEDADGDEDDDETEGKNVTKKVRV